MLTEHPPRGSIIRCDFSQGFSEPEMVKNRPVIVLTPRIKDRPGLCTVAALSGTPPEKVMPCHAQTDIMPVLPTPFESKGIWVKGDMVNAVSYIRLRMPSLRLLSYASP